MPIKQLLDLDPKEEVLKEIKRHPIGLWGLYIFGFVSIGSLLLMLYWIIRTGGLFTLELPDIIYILLFSFLVFMFAAFTYVGIYVYRTNELVVTNENIIQVLQFGLFNRQISQLNLAKIQDVSVDQIGIFSSFFGYGTLEIETAGEAANFRFPYAPNPNEVAKIIIEAHEDYVRHHRRPTGTL